MVKEDHPFVPVVDHSKRYPETVQLPEAVALVTADHVIFIDVGLMSASGTEGNVIAYGTVGVNTFNVVDQVPVPA